MCVLYTVCKQTKLRCEKGELKIKLNVFTTKIRLEDDFQFGTAQSQHPNVYKHFYDSMECESVLSVLFCGCLHFVMS